MSELVVGMRITMPDGSDKEFNFPSQKVSYTNVPELDAALIGFYWSGYGGYPDNIIAVTDNADNCVIILVGNIEIARLRVGINYVRYSGGKYNVYAYLVSLPNVSSNVVLTREARDIAYSPVIQLHEDISTQIDEVREALSNAIISQGFALNSLNATTKPSIVYKRSGEQYQIVYDEALEDNPSIFTADANLVDVMYLDCVGVEDLNDIFGGKDYGSNQVTNRPLQSIVVANMSPSYNGIDRTFAGLKQLKHLRIDNIDTSVVERMQFTYTACSNLTECDMTDWILSKLKWLSVTWKGCARLKRIKFPPNIGSISKALDMDTTFNGCGKLEEIDLSMLSDDIHIKRISGCFYGCTTIHSIDMGLADFSEATLSNNTFGNCFALENFTGLNNAKQSYSLSKSPLLSYDSAVASIDRLYDLTEGGTVTDYTPQTLTFNAATKALLSDEDIAIATAKGWNIAG